MRIYLKAGRFLSDFSGTSYVTWVSTLLASVQTRSNLLGHDTHLPQQIVTIAGLNVADHVVEVGLTVLV